MGSSLYSVRMRATYQSQHLAGAERIVTAAAVSETTAALTSRAMSHVNGAADEVYCSVERIDPAIVRYEKLPDIFTHQMDDWQEGRQLACCLLSRAGVQEDTAARAVQLLANGAGPEGSVMRGAVIMDATTGERLERDPSRGVRVSRMDLAPECRSKLERELISVGLDHHRVLEALVLAGKVLNAPGIVAELCWSDNPDYTTGYVAALHGGYQRISALKPVGNSLGSRVFFVDPTAVAIDELIDYLECQPVLFDGLGDRRTIRKPAANPADWPRF
jgi:6-carboxyhexanoate--CoA ligase